MKRLYTVFCILVLILTIYGSGVTDTSELTTKFSARLKRTDDPELWTHDLTTSTLSLEPVQNFSGSSGKSEAYSETVEYLNTGYNVPDAASDLNTSSEVKPNGELYSKSPASISEDMVTAKYEPYPVLLVNEPKIEIIPLADTGLVGSDLKINRLNKYSKKFVPFKKDVFKLAKNYDLKASKKRKNIAKRVKGFSKKLPFKKKSSMESKLEIDFDVSPQNDKIGEIEYPRPIISRFKTLRRRLSVRKRGNGALEANMSDENFTEESLTNVEEPSTLTDSLEDTDITETLEAVSESEERLKNSEDMNLKAPEADLPPSWNPKTEGTEKRPILSRVKNLKNKIPIRRKAQSKSDLIDLSPENRGVEENRIARLNVWWVRNFHINETVKPKAYYDEETIAVVGFDKALNSTACRLLEPVLKEEKEKALEDLSLAGVELKPSDFDTMLHMIAGCKNEGIPDDKWNTWTLLNGILPGTKWCGRGDVAKSYEELGPEADIDRCCRAHDHCPIKIKPFKRKYGLTNISLYTKSHCDCDGEFEMCLRATKNPLADVLANFYFNVLKVSTFNDYKI
ncbi:hypothetical protein QYM36_008942 [Artemia franciscana]|uniref:Phospholipase A2-like central domain-containing protein n=1 Tax=Artemia franciscana TaxID=6661 RepID=A0AA88L6K3_ARTSF|nr:hypothetical protein QYM36_008942 [Artemia franciscana]